METPERVKALAGVEDGSFKAFQRTPGSKTVLCCVLLAGEKILDVRLSSIEVDGFDATEKLLAILDGMEAYVVILGGITFAGFNIVDPFALAKKINKPIIIYSGVRPNNGAMRSALMEHFDDWKKRWSIVERLGAVHETVSREGEPPIHFEVVGGSVDWAIDVLHSSALLCRIPEPVRVAGLIARGVSRAC
jgi:hypothetical protein